MRNVAIIGCGYVGTQMAKFWRECGYWITATTTTPEKITELETVAQRVVLVKGNDKIALRSLIQDQEGILLTIAPLGNRQVDAEEYRATYLETAHNLIWALQDASRVQQLIYTSSYAVYGNADGGWVDETSLVCPLNARGEVLRDTEQVLLASNSQSLKVSILRLGGIYGPNREFIRICRRFAGTTRPGDGQYYTNWIHLEDIVKGIDFVLSHGLEGVYNLVDDTPQLTRALVERACQYYGLAEVTWDGSQENLRPYSLQVSNQKIKAAGYSFIHREIEL